MYELHNIYTVEPNLVPTIDDPRIDRRTRALFKSCLKLDPTLVFLFSTELPGILARGTPKEPHRVFGGLFHKNTVNTLIDRSKDLLKRVPASAFHRMIHLFRTMHTSSFLTVTPHNFEYDDLYGGSRGEAQLILWTHDEKLGDINFAESRTTSKETVVQIIRDTCAVAKIAVNFENKLTDMYRIEEPEPATPNRYGVWIT